MKMYRKAERNQLTLEEFSLPFGGRLSADNRWVKLSKLMPWELIEDQYALAFDEDVTDGRPPIEARMLYGAEWIKEQENLTDERALDHITENPYMQYFLGLREFRQERLFDPSNLTRFRNRFTPEMINEVNEELYRRMEANEREKHKGDDNSNSSGGDGGERGKSDDDAKEQPSNSGTLILDATVAPADIRFPTDLSLLNECRENTEQMINELWEHTSRKGHKTGYIRKKARAKYLKVTKQRKPRKGAIKKAIREQLRYVKKNLETIERLMPEAGEVLPKKRLKRLETIREVAKQQEEMLETNTHTVENRIVSLRQPHVRPIVRGKARTPVEFGQKLAFSVVNGFTFIDRWDWDNFSEGNMLIESAERYKERHGFFPAVILGDSVYRNRANRKFCKLHGIRLCGPRLGRPKAGELDADREQAYRDSCERNIVESRNGIAKRRYGLNLIMSMLSSTAFTEAAFNVLVMNAALVLRNLLRYFLVWISGIIWMVFGPPCSGSEFFR